MNTPSEEFELSSTTLRGATASMEYRNARDILRAERKNPAVVYEVYAEEDGVLSGIAEAMWFLRARVPQVSGSISSLQDGDRIHNGDTVLSITGPYANFGLYRDLILGILASNSGWATAARRCVDAAGSTPVMVAGTSEIHPEVVGQMEYSAVKGGCTAVSTPFGGDLTSTTPLGSMSRESVLIWGSVGRAASLYDKHITSGMQRQMLVPTINDAIHESLEAARALSGSSANPLRAVRLELPENLGGGSPDYIKELKGRLNAGGFSSVDIHLAGNLTPDLIKHYEDSDAPIALYVVGRYIGSAPAFKLSSSVKEIDGKAVAPLGMIPGRASSARLVRSQG